MLVRRTNEWIPSLFNDLFNNQWMEKSNSMAPAINVIENEKSYQVELAAPGMSKDDFEVKINDNEELEINMEKKTESKKDEKHQYLRREFSYTKFHQILELPDDVEKEKIVAKVENGVLFIELPKTNPQAQPKVSRSIAIS